MEEVMRRRRFFANSAHYPPLDEVTGSSRRLRCFVSIQTTHQYSCKTLWKKNSFFIYGRRSYGVYYGGTEGGD